MKTAVRCLLVLPLCSLILLPVAARAQCGEIIIGELVVDYFVEEAEDFLKDYVKDKIEDLLKDIVSGLFTQTSSGICADENGLYILVGDGIHYDMAYIPLNADGSIPTNSTGRQVITNALGSAGEALAYDNVNGWVLGTKNGIDDEVRAFRASDLQAGDQDPESHLYTGIGSFDRGIDCRNGLSYITTSDKIWIGRFYKDDGSYEKKKYTKYDVPGDPNDVAVDDNGILFITTTHDGSDWLIEYNVGSDGRSLVELTRWELGEDNRFWGVAADGQLVYVVNQHDKQLEVFDYDGTRMVNAKFPTNCINPYYVTRVGDYAYVTDASDQGDTEQIIHVMQIDPSVSRTISATGMAVTCSRREALHGSPGDAASTIAADAAMAVISNQLSLTIQFRQSSDLVNWTNFGEAVEFSAEVPTNYPDLFFCVTSGQSDE
jgi:hypothetical protein